jgi:hypothetical protein
MAELANDPVADLLDHGGDVSIAGRLTRDKPGLEARLGAIEVDALKEDAMEMEVQIHQLCAQYDGIVLETLNLQGMKALWGRKVSDLGFGHFVQILHHVAAQTGTVVHHIDPWFPSSKRCHICGNLNACITLRDRVWTCACGMTHLRDHNAAINIFREGASSLGEGHVRLAPASDGR